MRDTARAWPRFEQGDRLAESAAVGEGARHDDPALCHQVGAGRHRCELGPELLDPAVGAEGTGDVREDRVLLHAARQVPKGLELTLRLAPAPEAVEGEPRQLANRHGGGGRLGEGSQQTASLLVPAPPVGPRSIFEPAPGAGDTSGPHGSRQRRVRTGAKLLGVRHARASASGTAIRAVIDEALVDPLLGRAGTSGSTGPGSRTVGAPPPAADLVRDGGSATAGDPSPARRGRRRGCADPRRSVRRAPPAAFGPGPATAASTGTAGLARSAARDGRVASPRPVHAPPRRAGWPGGPTTPVPA